MYEVDLERGAERDLKRLTPDFFRRVIVQIKALASNPRPSGCRKLSGSINDWRIRVGDYRVIYEIHDSSKTIQVSRIRHRREVYH